ncbi:MAG: SpoIIE family protein phosphatase [Lentisphaerae bacterium]|nr:SpoIIE family protein phosphatase [Lentisphaerota bacterium]
MNTNSEHPLFLDLAYSQCNKHGESICGDAFRFEKSDSDGRVVAVLSDGLGSGVKANILASMTATMASKFAAVPNYSILHAAEIMMSALPICQVRKISYATFTILNAWPDFSIRIVEMGNPPFLLFRQGEPIKIPFERLESEQWNDRKMKIYHFTAQNEDRIIFFSDGISQAAMGTPEWPLGWRESGCAAFVNEILGKTPSISSHELCNAITKEARRKEPRRINKDDMTCASLYFRHPRKMLIFTGPPYDRKHDAECARIIDTFDGEKAVCGGTSAEIIARELNRELKMDLGSISSEMPPMSTMQGIDLVTEGIFTLTKATGYLEKADAFMPRNPAGLLAEMMRRNDLIYFLVGTRINEAHQDPNLPQELELRRNIVQRIAGILKNQLLKKVDIKYV